MPKYGNKPKASAGYGSGMKRTAGKMEYGSKYKKKKKTAKKRMSYK